MANIRREFGDDLSFKNGNLGINTTATQEKVDVVGVVKGRDLNVTGVTSLTAYEGFLRADNQIIEETNLEFGNGLKASLSGEIIVGTGQTVIINDVVKDTVGVGVGTSPQWINLANTGNARIATGNRPVWNGNSFVFNNNGGFKVDNYSETFETSITVEWWGTSDYPTTTDYFVPVVRTSTGSWNDGFGFYQRNGSVYWWVNAWNGAQRTEIAATSFGMTHWVGTYDGSNLKLYRNGSLVDTGSSFTANITEPSNGLLIGEGGGNDSSSDYHWDGNISIVRIYSRALTASEISSQYELGSESLLTVAEPDAAHFNANNPLSYPGKVNTVDTTDINLAGGSQIECLKVYNTFTPPSGGTNERPYKPKPGELYYNYDFKTIEFHDGYGWRQVDNTTKSSRGICAGGEPTVSNICLFNINTLGSSRNFGDLTASRANLGAVSSGTRGIFAGGEPATDLIQYITIASEGNAIDFDGNLTASRRFVTGCSSSTRGLFMGGAEPSTRVNKIDYIEMATAGVNAQDFGDLTETKDAGGGGSWSNGVRGGIFGGFNPGNSNRIDVVTIASKGNAVNFGTTIGSRHNVAAASNNVRAIAAGGSPETVRTIQYITMASDGNASYFGDLTTGTTGMNACANGTRIVWSGGNTSPAKVTTQQYVNIASAGNALDFGDISYVGVQQPGCLSDSHGGLGGF